MKNDKEYEDNEKQQKRSLWSKERVPHKKGVSPKKMVLDGHIENVIIVFSNPPTHSKHHNVLRGNMNMDIAPNMIHICYLASYLSTAFIDEKIARYLKFWRYFLYKVARYS